MPSATFLNLPQEKQEKLLEAATREFSRRSFNDASINQIIKDAGIPRGSFYMYFADKTDLFRYLMSGYVDQILSLLEELLIREQGDIFEALLDLFDYVQRRRNEDHLGETGAMLAILGRNVGMQRSTVLEMISPGEIMDRLGRLVNADQLHLEQEQDLRDILAVLLAVSGPLIYNGALPCDTDGTAARAHFKNVLRILRRGMERQTLS